MEVFKSLISFFDSTILPSVEDSPSYKKSWSCVSSKSMGSNEEWFDLKNKNLYKYSLSEFLKSTYSLCDG